MKFTIDPADLKEAVRFALTAIAGNPPYPVLKGVLINASGDELVASGTDEIRTARVHVPATVEEGGEVLLHAPSLAQLVSKFKGKSDVVIREDDKKLWFTQGKMKFALYKMPSEDYPRQLEKNLAVIGHINGEAFSGIVSAAEVAASKDIALPLLMAVNIQIGSEVSTLGTDRYRLSTSFAEWEPLQECSYSINAPAAWLKSVAKNIGGETSLLIAQDGGVPNRIGITSGNYSASSSLISGDYPKVRSLFTNRGELEHIVDRQGMIDALDFVSVMTERNVPVLLTGRDGLITFESGGAEGESTTEIASSNDEPFRIGLKPSLALDILRTLSTDLIRFVPNGPKPIHLSATEGNAEYLLMPVRLTNQ